MSHSHHSHDDHVGSNTVPPLVHETIHVHDSKADHSDHGGGDDSSGSAGHMMMKMWFHTGYGDTILFEQWAPTEVGGMVGSCIFIFFLAFAYEGLKYYREHLYRRSFTSVQYNTVSVPAENGPVRETQKTVQVKMFSMLHTWQTVLHVVQTIISYFLMLIFMTYNVWLCLAVALGAGIGYFFFGWKKSLVVDITEHCH